MWPPMGRKGGGGGRLWRGGGWGLFRGSWGGSRLLLLGLLLCRALVPPVNEVIPLLSRWGNARWAAV